MIESYKDLIIWQKSIELTKMVYKAVKSIPKEEKFGLTMQLKRAAVSVPSNIAEGWSRNSDRTLIQFLNISKGSLAEIDTLVTIVKETQSVPVDVFIEIEKSADEISRMIQSLKYKIDLKIKKSELKR